MKTGTDYPIMSDCSILIPLYQRTIELINTDTLSDEAKYELYAIIKYMDIIYDSNKESPYIHKIIQLACCALKS